MRIEWLGHASFLIETNGKKIITDPYQPGSYDGAVGYKPISIMPDIVTISHEHADHNWREGFKQENTVILDKPGQYTIEGINIEAIPSFHDDQQGALRGENLIFSFYSEGIRLMHLGDLGTHRIEMPKRFDVDILLVPVGGIYTIDAGQAKALVEQLNPSIVVPMHFKTPKLGFGIDRVDNFTRLFDNVEVSTSSAFEVFKETLPANVKILVLQPSH